VVGRVPVEEVTNVRQRLRVDPGGSAAELQAAIETRAAALPASIVASHDASLHECDEIHVYEAG